MVLQLERIVARFLNQIIKNVVNYTTGSKDTQAVKEGWHIYLYKKGDLGESFADLGGIKTDTFTGWFGYVPDTFYVRVTSSSTRTNYMPVDCPFDITVVYEATNEWEKEMDSKAAKA